MIATANTGLGESVGQSSCTFGQLGIRPGLITFLLQRQHGLPVTVLGEHVDQESQRGKVAMTLRYSGGAPDPYPINDSTQKGFPGTWRVNYALVLRVFCTIRSSQEIHIPPVIDTQVVISCVTVGSLSLANMMPLMLPRYHPRPQRQLDVIPRVWLPPPCFTWARRAF